jgi:sporulation protein YlmC with PRC-barrel domain
MLKKLMVTTAITALMIGAASAEGTDATQRPNSAPAVTAPTAPSPAVKSTEPAAKSSEMTAPATKASAVKFINSQQSDQFLASKFKGTDVLGTDGQKIGDVTDILFDKSGKVLAYVVGVGGFLGIGAKDVALEPSAFEIVKGDPAKHESDKLKIAMTKDELKQAAVFEPYKVPVSTTGMGPGALGSRPAPSRPAPATPQ